MNSAYERKERLLPSDLLLLLLIFTLPLMKPAVSDEVIAADLLFLVLVVALGLEAVAKMRRVGWIKGFGPLLAYVACMTPSLLATGDMRASLFKLSTELYLIGLAAVTAWLVDSEARFRRATLAWLAAAALVSLDGVLSLLAFASGRATWLLHDSSFIFGSLPPGAYPRLDLTFFNANMACNYLTVGFALALGARSLGYFRRRTFWLLTTGIAIAALSTISPGLGGIALLAGIWIWINKRESSPGFARSALILSVLAAVLFLLALALTPFAHSTAPFLIHLPGGLVLYPASRFLTWSAALKQFLSHPLVGIGIGVDPVHVGFANPSGFQVLTDAHNLFLSIAAQCGLIGLIGLAAIIAFVIARMARPSIGNSLICFLLGAAFLDVFVYQGLGGSFEDTRHIWVLLGLFMAASRIDFSRAGGNSRTTAAPSHG